MNQQSTMRETLNLLNGVITGKRILNEGRVGQIADDLESLSDVEFEKEYGKTKSEMRKSFSDKEEVKEMDYGGGRSPHAGMGLPRDDGDDAGKQEVMVKPITAKKMKNDANDIMDKEFSKAYDKTGAVSEAIPNSDEDPNLRKAYNMGHDAYKSYGDDPATAQAIQDKIGKEFPQYLKMWTTGYRDGQRFDKQAMREAGDPNRFDPRASRRHPGDVDVAEGEGMSRAAKGHEKYGKKVMMALAKAGREGRDLDPIRDKYNKYDESVQRDKSFDLSEYKAFLDKRI